MRRAGRIVAVGCASASIVATAATAALWYRSGRSGDYLQLNAPRVGLGWFSTGGTVRMSVATAAPPARMDAGGVWSWTTNNGFPGSGLRGWRLRPDSGSNGVGGQYYGLSVYYWEVATAAALPGTVAAAGWLRPGRRPGPGTCRRCGYDLRASPGRCPECGTVPAVP